MHLKMKSNPLSLFQNRIMAQSLRHKYTAVDILAYMSFFFVYVPVCVVRSYCGGQWRDPGTLEGGEGLIGRGRTSSITAGLWTVTWHEIEHANIRVWHKYPNKNSNTTTTTTKTTVLRTCIAMQHTINNYNTVLQYVVTLGRSHIMFHFCRLCAYKFRTTWPSSIYIKM
jgi:hypothetical protein